MRYHLIAILIISVFILSACSTGEASFFGSKKCKAGWICLNSQYKAYQYSSCLTAGKTYCNYGCSGGACKPPQSWTNKTNATNTTYVPISNITYPINKTNTTYKPPTNKTNSS